MEDFLQMAERLSPKTRKEFEDKGKLMYNTIDFESGKSQLTDNTPPSSVDALRRALKDGLRLHDLDEQDFALYEKFIKKNDLNKQ